LTKERDSYRGAHQMEQELRVEYGEQLDISLARVGVLERLASCLASAVKCGEPWTDTLEQEYRAALAQPAATGEGEK